MGVNNRKRRAAKQRKRARQQSATRRAGRQSAGNPFVAPEWDAVTAHAFVDLQLTGTVRRLSKRRKLDDDEVGRHAESLERQILRTPGSSSMSCSVNCSSG